MYKTIPFVICCRFLVSVLEALVRTFNLTKLVLTVFDSNAREHVIQEKKFHIYGKLRKQVGGQPQFNSFYIFFFIFSSFSHYFLLKSLNIGRGRRVKPNTEIFVN